MFLLFVRQNHLDVEMATPKKICFTRRDFHCPIFGNPSDFQPNKLPTYEDVMKCCFQARYDLSLKCNNKRVSFSEAATIVSGKIILLYEKTSIPTLSEQRIVKLMTDYHKKYYQIRKSYVRDKNKHSFNQKLEDFKLSATLLFDFAACKCLITVDCNCTKKPDLCECPVAINCKCDKVKKIPVIELRFMYLQRKYGFGKIGPVDLLETQKLGKRLQRKNKLSDYYRQNESSSTTSTFVHAITNESEDGHEEEESNIDEPFVPEGSFETPQPPQMRLNLGATALASDRYGVSERATAAIASSVLQDLGVINEEDSSHVVDKSKIRREKINLKRNLQCEPHNEPLRGLYFDGRKDDTIVMEIVGSKHFRRTVKENHYVMLQEPGSKYLGHVSPSIGQSKFISMDITSYLNAQNISLDDLDVIGCDGTPINTGWKNGVIRQIELHVGRPIQWSICLLHFNELPFRHLFQHLDGTSTGPNSFSGAIGQKLKGCEKLPVIDFSPVKCSVPEIDKNVLSKDQVYLLDISTAIRSGQCPIELAVRDPGPLSHSRWLTTANKVLRLYVSQQNPSQNLNQVVYFILNCYMPLWFQIKLKSEFSEGPKVIYETIKMTRYLPQVLLNVVNPVIERNAFFAHPENIILTMILDERKDVRELGLKRFLKARELSTENVIRSFKVPKLNFNATDYVDMIYWDACETTPPPPLLRKISDQELEQSINTGAPLNGDFNVFPCHTQAVERCVKLVTEASEKVCGADMRDGYIRTTLFSRSIMPNFSTKSSFKVHL